VEPLLRAETSETESAMMVVMTPSASSSAPAVMQRRRWKRDAGCAASAAPAAPGTRPSCQHGVQASSTARATGALGDRSMSTGAALVRGVALALLTVPAGLAGAAALAGEPPKTGAAPIVAPLLA